jgi:hypothetical protein
VARVPLALFGRRDWPRAQICATKKCADILHVSNEQRRRRRKKGRVDGWEVFSVASFRLFSGFTSLKDPV